MNKQKIIVLFLANIKNQPIMLKSKASGSEGHWVESCFGLKPNNRNEPDIFGFELKKLSNKITFGDFSASEYLFTSKRTLLTTPFVERNQFIRYFGTQKPSKHNRFSWSGKCFPVFGEYNDCGQIIEVSDENDILINYSYYHDKREIELPEYLTTPEKICIAVWKREKLEKHINSKFNQNGFCILSKNEKNLYDKIHFGGPFGFEQFIKKFKEKKIFIDSGMYMGNNRNYSQFRANKDFWMDLVIETY